MPVIDKQMVKCPKCGKEIAIDIWDSVDMPYDAQHKDAVMKNAFFTGHCEDCDLLFPVAYKCTYNDMERRYLIWIDPRPKDIAQKAIDSYNDKLKTDDGIRLARIDYTLRIVRNTNDLREKILIFDEGLDDRYIETMKLAYLPVFKKSYPDSKVVGIYFDKNPERSDYHWVVAFDNRTPVVVPINMDMYADMKRDLADYVEANTPEGLAEINVAFAANVFADKAKAEKGND